jgi:transcription-repair coupling factor (superfamily II helicase)
MSHDAKKRIEAIQAATTLGAGFALASHDLEIRGAGELLGDEQSGHMQKIGFSLYTEMLEEAVSTIKAGKKPTHDMEMGKSIEINLRIPALIPDTYLPDVHMRLIMYKRISSSRDNFELEDLQIEMIDRFGLFPEPLSLLFRLTRLKLKAQIFDIKKIDANSNNGKIEFLSKTQLDPLSLVQLIQENPQSYKLTGANQLQFHHGCEQATAKLDFIDELLDKFRLVKQKAS